MLTLAKGLNGLVRGELYYSQVLLTSVEAGVGTLISRLQAIVLPYVARY